MRVNIYAEELTSRVELQTKMVNGTWFYGVSFYLESSDKLHELERDNDSSLVTFWYKNRESALLLMQNFNTARKLIAKDFFNETSI